MEAQLSTLRQLQQFDLEIQEITDRTDRLRESLDELLAISESLSEALEAQKGQLEETRSLMRQKEVELEENLDRYNQSKAKLNAVANTKQYNALEKEMDTLKKQRAQLEEERDTLRENVESFEADVAEKQSKIDELDKQINAERKAVDKESSSADKRVKKLENEREDLREQLPKPIFRRYQFIHSRRPGAAVVPAIAGVCTGCNMTVPPQLFNELQMAKKIIQCPNCQRILYHQAEDEA